MKYTPIGSYDDLLVLLATAEERFFGLDLPRKTRWGRHFIQPLCQLFGISAAAVGRAMPPDMLLSVQDWIYRQVEGDHKQYEFDSGAEALREAKELRRQVSADAGKPAGIVCLIAHPPVDEELLYLNIELFRHALQGIRQIRGRPCRPQLLNAIDIFALDMLPLCQEGIYAGFMGSQHLGLDRLSWQRSRLSRKLLRKSAWPSIGTRIGKLLSRGGELIVLPGGGIPRTSRVFYCARELVGHLCRQRPNASPPSEIRERLSRSAPEFEEFLASGAVGPTLSNNLWRSLEAWVMASLIDGTGLADAHEGNPSAAGEEALKATMDALGWPESDAQQIMKDFREEFSRETPYRIRFFSLLAERVVARGTPLVLLPLTFGCRGQVQIAFGSPVALTSVRGNRRQRVVKVLTPQSGTAEYSLDDFGRDFVVQRFD